jgi:DNA primase
MNEVEELLSTKGIEYIRSGGDLLVSCLNPEHEDTNPSMRIDKNSGAFHCFSCGYKGNVFTKFNKHRNVAFNRSVTKLLESIREVKEASSAGLELPPDAFFVSKEFRGVSVKTLEKFGAFTTGTIEGRIVFPLVDMSGRIQHFHARRMHGDAKPKYLTYPRHKQIELYPVIGALTPINNSIVLVEGYIDALYLHSAGLENAVSTFGTNTVSEENVEERLMPYMLAGIDTVYIMFDGDTAGRSAQKRLKDIIALHTDLEVETINLPEGQDPASLTQEDIDSIKEYIISKGVTLHEETSSSTEVPKQD